MKFQIKKYCFLIYLTFSISTVYGQDDDELFPCSGQIISKDGKNPVALAHVINLQQKCGVVADTSGYFEIRAKSGDTLDVSALGFDYFEYPVIKESKNQNIMIYLQTRFYDIPEVSITYLGTYKEFKQKVLDLKLPDSGINKEIEKIFKHVDVQPVLVPSTSILNPASMIYSMFSKEAKDILKYVELTKNQHVIDEAYKRYNVELVKNLTGFDEYRTREFMAFCNFTEEYIVSISDYKLYDSILKRLEVFKKIKADSLKIE